MNEFQVFGFHSETLLMVYHTVAWLMVILTVLGLWHIRARFGFGFWVGSFLVVALAQSLRPLVSTYWGQYVSFSFGHMGGLASAAFVYLGVRAFLGLPLQALKIGLIVAIGCVGSLLINFNDVPNMHSLMLTLSLGAVLRLWAAVDAIQAWRRQGSRAWALMSVFLVVSAILQLVRAASVQWSQELPTVERELIHGQMLLISTSMLFTQGICILILLSDAFYQQALRMAEQDALTGLLNRRGLQNKLVQATSGRTRHVFLLDVDHFKRINDQHGHAAGDAVLKELGRRFSALTQTEPMAGNCLMARIGGEEFVLVCEGLSADAAEQLAERFVSMVRDQAIALESGSLKVTISVGLSESDSSAPFEHQLKQSDAALYDAKRSGRDRWVKQSRISSMASECGVSQIP
jgi:diguanylate cyclase (GGDEF)-like protein